MQGVIAESATASEQYQGVPVVRLYDSAQDVKTLLRVIYDPWFVFSPSYRLLAPPHHRVRSQMPSKWWKGTHMEEAASIIRLARKYQADELYQHFLQMYKAAWPTNLHEWDKREKEKKRIWQEPEAAVVHVDDPDPDAERDYIPYRAAIAEYLPDPGTYCCIRY